MEAVIKHIITVEYLETLCISSQIYKIEPQIKYIYINERENIKIPLIQHILIIKIMMTVNDQTNRLK